MQHVSNLTVLGFKTGSNLAKIFLFRLEMKFNIFIYISAFSVSCLLLYYVTLFYSIPYPIRYNRLRPFFNIEITNEQELPRNSTKEVNTGITTSHMWQNIATGKGMQHLLGFYLAILH